jgi:integrase
MAGQRARLPGKNLEHKGGGPFPRCLLRHPGTSSSSPARCCWFVVGAVPELAKPSVKQHLAAIRMLCDYLVTGGVLRYNPASSVRGPKYVTKRGKTPVLDDDQIIALLGSIPVKNDDGSPDVLGLRDRALIAVMVFDFARVGAVVAMNLEDYYQQGKRWWLRLHEKGGKRDGTPPREASGRPDPQLLRIPHRLTENVHSGW